MNAGDAHGRAVLVTGGAQGIGRGIVEHLLAQGARILALDQDAAALTELAALQAPSQRGRLVIRVGDVADPRAAADAVAAAVAAFGGLHGLVNNAGIADPHSGPPEQLDLDRWHRVLAVNLTGAFLMARHALPHLRAARGAIVNIASTRALQSEPCSEAYAASKGGLLALTHALAASVGPEVRVNAVSPGWIDVGMLRPSRAQAALPPRRQDHAWHSAGRVGVAADVAAAVAFLLSDAAAFITGENLVVDGGVHRRMRYPE